MQTELPHVPVKTAFTQVILQRGWPHEAASNADPHCQPQDFVFVPPEPRCGRAPWRLADCQLQRWRLDLQRSDPIHVKSRGIGFQRSRGDGEATSLFYSGEVKIEPLARKKLGGTRCSDYV